MTYMFPRVMSVLCCAGDVIRVYLEYHTTEQV